MKVNKKVVIIVLSVLVMVLIVLNVFFINLAFRKQNQGLETKHEDLIFMPNKPEDSVHFKKDTLLKQSAFKAN